MNFSFEEMPKAFLVSLSYDEQLQNIKTAVNVTENVTERASLLIEIKNNPFITTSELAVKLNITSMTVHRDLEKLKKAGTIFRI